MLALLGAAVAAAVVLSQSNRAHHTLAAYGRLRSAVVARRDLTPGRRLTATDVGWRPWPAGLVPRDAVTSSPVGRTLIGSLGPGEVVTRHRLAPDGLRGLAALVAPDHRAVSVPVPAHGLALAVGDQVDILVADDATDAESGEEPDGGTGGPPLGQVVAHGARVLAPGGEAVVVEVTVTEAGRVAAALGRGTPVLALVGAS